MTLLLTILSVVAGLALLSTLILGLLFVLKPLESVRRSLRQIAMGVRAIEYQVIGLGERASAFETDLARAADRSASVAGRLAATGTTPPAGARPSRRRRKRRRKGGS